MIIHLIEARVSYNKLDEQKGYIKKVWERYLLNDISLAAVENRIVEIVSPLSYDGEVSVDALSHTKYSEVIGLEDSSETDLWFYVKVYYITVDAKTHREKREPVNFLVRAASPHEASVKVTDSLKDCMTDYKIDRLVEMAYADVFLEDSVD